MTRVAQHPTLVHLIQEADMRRTGFGHSLLVVLAVVGLVTTGAAQGTKSARGTLTAISGDTITVKTGTGEMKFAVDAKTVLVASGAGTAARKATASGKPGLNLTDFVKAGDNIEVSYVESGGTMRATNIRHVGAGGGGGEAAETELATGTVDSMTGSTLTVSGSIGGGGTFKQTYTVDEKTRVIAVGAGTASAAKQGKVAFADFVGVGDQVTVTYSKMGTSLHADEVRVRAKKK
jgi:hypothetical protein